MWKATLACWVNQPVISATKNAKDIEIVMMSRVLGLRLKAILMDGWVQEARRMNDGGGDLE